MVMVMSDGKWRVQLGFPIQHRIISYCDLSIELHYTRKVASSLLYFSAHNVMVHIIFARASVVILYARIRMYT